MYSNKILNFQESTAILNACTKKTGNLLNLPRIICEHILMVWFGLVSLFNGISTFVGYLIPKLFSKKNSSATI